MADRGIRYLILHTLTLLAAMCFTAVPVSAAGAPAAPASFAPASEGLDTWRPGASVANPGAIDHGAWATLLDRYLVSNHPSGVNRFRYSAVTAADRTQLNAYLARLARTDPRVYSRNEQMAYWINLYNAATVHVILANPGVNSIRDISDSFFVAGPWDREDIQVGGQQLSLNHIEHGILRPFFTDKRIHYAVNCASIGCPNLAPQPFTGARLEAQLDAAEHDYLNHPRGLQLDGSRLNASSIFRWYSEDFPAGESALRAYWAEHLDDATTAAAIRAGKGRLRYRYDWSLNAP